MDGHEQIRVVTARDLGPAPEADVVVAVADEDRLHPRGAVDPALERAGNGEHDVLLPDPRPGDRAGVFAAVAGVHRDHHLSVALRSALPALPAHHLPLRLATDRTDVDDETVAVLRIGLEQKALGTHPLLHVEHDPQVVAGPVTPPTLGALALRGADALEEAVPGTGPGNTLQEPCVAQVDDHPVGVAKHEQRVLDRTIDVENDPGVVGRGPRPDALDVDGRGARRPRHQAPEADCEEPHLTTWLVVLHKGL